MTDFAGDYERAVSSSYRQEPVGSLGSIRLSSRVRTVWRATFAGQAQFNKERARSMGAEKNKDKTDRLKNKEYEKELRRLQGELRKLQDWVKHKGLRVIVIFEGEVADVYAEIHAAFSSRRRDRDLRLQLVQPRRCA
jgi:Polyphosphate kinase 2 (PPK2)